jgi:flagellar hook-associated protein 2
MATISSAGVGSGLDINSLVSQLVAAERATKDKRLAREESKLATEFTALAALKGAMSGLQGAANGLRTPDSFATRKVSVGDDEYFSAAAAADAVEGSYDVQVVQLAKAARLGSAAYAGGPDSVAGTGTLTITAGAASFSIELADGANSLAQVRDAINSAEGNTGVRATLIRDASGTFLLLTGTSTGAANAISVSAQDADTGLQQLVADLTDFDATRDVAAQDAIAYVSGYEVRSSGNAIDNAIDGVTLNLKKVTGPGETISLSVERDTAAIQKKADTLVAAYNSLTQQIKALGRYDAATETAGPMLGDSLLRGVDTQLRRMVTEPVPGTTGAYRTLSSVGISITATGTLQLDAVKFQKALAADPDAVNKVFSSESGVAVRMGEYLDARLSSSGEFAARDERITTQRRRLEQDKVALEARMLVVQQRYLKQFTAMDTMLAQLQSTSSYLTQQLSSLAKASASGD